MALLRCSVMSSIGGSQLAFLTITDGQSTNSAAPPADTRRVSTFAPSGASVDCACTFYLVFKEPDACPTKQNYEVGSLPDDVDRREGNLTIILNAPAVVNRRFFLPITAERAFFLGKSRGGRAEER